MGKHLIFLGAPGSGKGTQAKNLVREKGYHHISTGDLLRAEMNKGSELGKEVESVINAGKLVDDDLMIKILKSNLDWTNPVIFDGYPRNLEQVKVLDAKVLKDQLYQAVYFKVDIDSLVKRLVNRRICNQCGAIYNLETRKPAQEGVCDKCGSQDIVHRKDDHENVIRDRLDVFMQTILPVLDYYREKNLLMELDAEKNIEELQSELLSTL